MAFLIDADVQDLRSDFLWVAPRPVNNLIHFPEVLTAGCDTRQLTGVHVLTNVRFPDVVPATVWLIVEVGALDGSEIPGVIRAILKEEIKRKLTLLIFF